MTDKVAVDPKILALYTPKKEEKFMKRDVEKLIEEILRRDFSDRKYVYEESLQWTKDLSSEIQNRMQDRNYTRYKSVVQVTITEAAGQGMRIASRCLWDPDADNFAEVVFSTEYMHIVVLVFGLYWE
eukprot:PhF_6_TR17302/c0_g1_i1/m.26521